MRSVARCGSHCLEYQIIPPNPRTVDGVDAVRRSLSDFGVGIFNEGIRSRDIFIGGVGS